MPFYCGSVDVGNYLYEDNCAEGFLHIQEALEILPKTIGLEIVEEKNFYMSATGDNTILNCLQSFHIFPEDYFAIFIINGIAFSAYSVGTRIVLVDSHAHNDYGGKFDIMNVNKLLPSDISFELNDNIAYMCKM